MSEMYCTKEVNIFFAFIQNNFLTVHSCFFPTHNKNPFHFFKTPNTFLTVRQHSPQFDAKVVPSAEIHQATFFSKIKKNQSKQGRPAYFVEIAWDKKFETGFYDFKPFHENNQMKTFMCMLQPIHLAFLIYFQNVFFLNTKLTTIFQMKSLFF